MKGLLELYEELAKRVGLGTEGVVVVGVEPGAAGDELSSYRSSILRTIFMGFMLHMLV